MDTTSHDSGFLELARRRQSDRGYTDRDVPRPVIERCLEAARLAPSACNSQPWFFVAVDEPSLRRKVAECLHDMVMPGNRFALTAPLIIAVVAEPPTLLPRLGGAIKGKPFHLMDLGMAVENLCLQAADEGLGSCILGWFDERKVQQILGIPRLKRVPLVVTIGYPATMQIREKSRRKTSDVWSFNGYRKGNEKSRTP